MNSHLQVTKITQNSFLTEKELCSAKRADIREKWLIAQREYERKRKVNENEDLSKRG